MKITIYVAREKCDVIYVYCIKNFTNKDKTENKYRSTKQKRSDDKKQITTDAEKSANLLSVSYQHIANGIDNAAMEPNGGTGNRVRVGV